MVVCIITKHLFIFDASGLNLVNSVVMSQAGMISSALFEMLFCLLRIKQDYSSIDCSTTKQGQGLHDDLEENNLLQKTEKGMVTLSSLLNNLRTNQLLSQQNLSDYVCG